MVEPLIAIRELSKVYPMGEVEVHALRGVSLEIGAGEFVAVMGASGSGKSTFMNILGCLDRPTSGTYRLRGIDVTIRNREVGFVFQNFNLLSRTSAIENVELPLVYGDSPQREHRRRAQEALSAVGLAGREHHHPNQLSGGQQQRVAIARALVNQPALLLADEPTGNLDTPTSMEILDIFESLNREHGITVVLVTHEESIARFARRAILFRDGQIVSDEAQAPGRAGRSPSIRLVRGGTP